MQICVFVIDGSSHQLGVMLPGRHCSLTRSRGKFRERSLRRVLRTVFTVFLAFAIIGLTIWATLALWYRLPAPEAVRYGVGSITGVLGCAVAIVIFTRWRIRALSGFTAAFAVILIWWGTINPPEHAEWAPDVARQVTGVLEGDVLVLTNVRDFDWRAENDFTERWVTRSYDLTKLRSVDLFMSYWAGPHYGHVILSFGFEDGTYLAWSIEVRRKVGGKFSPLADFFKSNPLVFIAAEERDVVGVRSNVRGEKVQLFRLRTRPEIARPLLLEFVRDANALSKTPKFYNSIKTNCTTVVVKMMRAVNDNVPLDWRLIVNGYLPDYAYDQGALDSRLPIEVLRTVGTITDRAQDAKLNPDYSRLIRKGVPSPND